MSGIILGLRHTEWTNLKTSGLRELCSQGDTERNTHKQSEVVFRAVKPLSVKRTRRQAWEGAAVLTAGLSGSPGRQGTSKAQGGQEEANTKGLRQEAAWTIHEKQGRGQQANAEMDTGMPTVRLGCSHPTTETSAQSACCPSTSAKGPCK